MHYSSKKHVENTVGFLPLAQQKYGIMTAFLSFIIALSANESNSQAWNAFQLGIKHVNSDSSLLSNTKLAAFEDQLSANQNMFDYGKRDKSS